MAPVNAGRAAGGSRRVHAMIGEWLIFALTLFVIEPLHLHERMAASPDPAARRLRRV